MAIFSTIGLARDLKTEPPHLKHTAKCISTSFGDEHDVGFCEVRMLDVNTIDLFIYQFGGGFDDALRVQIRNGAFTCQVLGL